MLLFKQVTASSIILSITGSTELPHPGEPQLSFVELERIALEGFNVVDINTSVISRTYSVIVYHSSSRRLVAALIGLAAMQSICAAHKGAFFSYVFYIYPVTYVPAYFTRRYASACTELEFIRHLGSNTYGLHIRCHHVDM